MPEEQGCSLFIFKSMVAILIMETQSPTPIALHNIDYVMNVCMVRQQREAEYYRVQTKGSKNEVDD